MSTMHPIADLDKPGLREFGLTMGAVIAPLFGLLIPWLFGRAYPLWPWAMAALLALWAAAAPLTLRPVYRGWMRLGLLINRITAPVILGAVFFLVITPAGLVMRLFGHDPMVRRFDAHAPSYRIPSRKAPKEHMEKPF